MNGGCQTPNEDCLTFLKSKQYYIRNLTTGIFLDAGCFLCLNFKKGEEAMAFTKKTLSDQLDFRFGAIGKLDKFKRGDRVVIRASVFPDLNGKTGIFKFEAKEKMGIPIGLVAFDTPIVIDDRVIKEDFINLDQLQLIPSNT